MPSKGDTTKQDKGIKTCKMGVDEDRDGRGWQRMAGKASEGERGGMAWASAIGL